MKKNLSSLCRSTFARTGLLLLLSKFAFSQPSDKLTIDSCYQYAKNNYPLIKQRKLIASTTAYSIENATKAYFPQLSVNGQATYQSDVTQIPITLPNVSVPSLSKDQYKIYGEVTQPLTDAILIHQQKQLIRDNAVADDEKLEVELYKLKERVNQLYYGILLIDAQLQQTELLKKDIQTGIDKTNAALANGMAFKSAVNTLKAELLKADQRAIELKTNRKGYADMLGMLINKPLSDKTIFEYPSVKSALLTVNRPELRMYDAQKKIFTAQERLINARNIPRLALFIQSGYGKPALNMLNPDFDFYYIGGLRLSWNISALYTFKKDKKLLLLNQDAVELQRQTFLFNTQLSLTQQQAEQKKLEELIQSDEEIIALRSGIKTTASVQLENGSISVMDYVSYVNAEDQAKQSKLLHQIQLLITQSATQTISGN